MYIIYSNDLSCHIPSEISGFWLTSVQYAVDVQLVTTGSRSPLAEMEHCMFWTCFGHVSLVLQNDVKVNATKAEIQMCGNRRQLGSRVVGVYYRQLALRWLESSTDSWLSGGSDSTHSWLPGGWSLLQTAGSQVTGVQYRQLALR